MQKGFTLAEVLITLGIIGIVAAMTMPVINAKTQDLVLDSQYKKSQNILSNGYKLMMAKSSTYQVENLPFCLHALIINVYQWNIKIFFLL